MTEQEIAKLREEAERAMCHNKTYDSLLDLPELAAYFSAMNQKAIEDAKKEGRRE